MPKIAIIDDDIDIVEATGILMESRGYEVVSAGNVEDGLELVQKENPDLIILDVMMQEPDDGFFLAMKLRKIGISKPIIMLTSVAKATGLDFGTGGAVPVEVFLEKPVPPSTLMENVNKLLGKGQE